MRALIVVAFAAIVLGVVGCGSSQSPYARISRHQTVNPKRLGDPLSPVAGDVLFAGSGNWSGSPTGFSYAWKDCDSSGANCVTAAGSPTNTQRYVIVSGDEGSTIRVAVTASYSGHPDATVLSAPTAVVSSPAVPQVGAPSPSGVSCTTTISTGTSINTTLNAASPGDTVCLNAGTWSDPLISGTHSGNVTLAAKPGATVNFSSGLTLDGNTTNLTIEGMEIAGASVLSDANNIVFQYNTLETISKGYGFYMDADAHGGTHTATNVSYLYNQLDHVGACLEASRGVSNVTFSHNVCGPELGYGCTTSTDPGHYIEIGGTTGITVDNNAFEGPASSAISCLLHNNVLHVFGGTSTNVDFSNNIIWHADSRAQMVLLGGGGGDGCVHSLTINNNLDVEDPTSFPSADIQGQAFEVYQPIGFSFKNNTIDHSAEGVVFGATGTSCTGGDAGSSMTQQDNIMEPTSSMGALFNTFNCSATCTNDHNVSADTSASGTGSVTSWTPSFTSTSWTPTDGSPWSPPPAGYYQPVGLGFSAGYQGSIGP